MIRTPKEKGKPRKRATKIGKSKRERALKRVQKGRKRRYDAGGDLTLVSRLAPIVTPNKYIIQ